MRLSGTVLSLERVMRRQATSGVCLSSKRHFLKADPCLSLSTRPLDPARTPAPRNPAALLPLERAALRKQTRNPHKGQTVAQRRNGERSGGSITSRLLMSFSSCSSQILSSARCAHQHQHHHHHCSSSSSHHPCPIIRHRFPHLFSPATDRLRACPSPEVAVTLKSAIRLGSSGHRNINFRSEGARFRNQQSASRSR